MEVFPVDGYVLPKMIVALRELANMNQSQLSQALGISPSAVNQVEKSTRGIQEGVFTRYVKAIGYASEIEALARGVEALRAATAPAAPKPKSSKAKAKPGKPARARAPKRGAARTRR